MSRNCLPPGGTVIRLPLESKYPIRWAISPSRELSDYRKLLRLWQARHRYPYERDRRPGGDSPSMCITGEEAGRGRHSLQREKRLRAFRFLFFSAFFLSSASRALSRSVAAISRSRRNISSATRSRGRRGVGGNGHEQHPAMIQDETESNLFLFLSLLLFVRILRETYFTWTFRRGEIPHSFPFLPMRRKLPS